ncbi:MAG: hypothetical protein J6P03_00575 [Opitutales bacterium]|nr:hypothetical protein [Opitutales bacterium]
MKAIFFIFLGGFFLCGCYTHKITVIDAKTLQPVPDALVLTDKQYTFTSHVRAYKTNDRGVISLDYQPTSIFAGKRGYWMGTENCPNVIFLVDEKTDPSKYAQNKEFPALYAPYEYLDKGDPLYKEWKDYAENQKMLKKEFFAKSELKTR